MNPSTPHIAIIGGGAAGFFSALSIKQQVPQAQVTIYEANAKVLAKVAITGGGRCNLTNTFNNITDLSQAYPRGHRLLKRLFKTFDHLHTYRWFEQHGVPLTVQPDQCVFPVSQNAQSVVQCLVQPCAQMGIAIKLNHRLVRIENPVPQQFVLHFANGTTLQAHYVLIAVGGSPTGKGWQFLSTLQHSLEPPMPSLFTFNIAQQGLNKLMGTVVNPVSVSVPTTKFQAEGPLLVTHWGVSGPATLKLSSQGAMWMHQQNYRFNLSINWLHTLSQQQAHNLLGTFAQQQAAKQIGTLAPQALPSRLWHHLIEKGKLAPTKRWNELGKKDLNRLVNLLTNDTYMVSGKGTFKEEFVTCGGVALNELHPNTLESKFHPGLFFAGEVLNIDAITGGFNLQAAWTTGYVAAQAISARIND